MLWLDLSLHRYTNFDDQYVIMMCFHAKRCLLRVLLVLLPIKKVKFPTPKRRHE